MLGPAILGRKLDKEVINFGMSAQSIYSKCYFKSDIKQDDL